MFLVNARAPYRLKAVSDPAELVGRDQLVDQLISGLTGDDMTSSTVSGQKRVGKTSIVKTLETRVHQDCPEALVVYLQVSAYRSAPMALYRAIAQALVRVARKGLAGGQEASAIALPSFEYGFSDVIPPVEEILSLDEQRRLVLILDEFDEIPSTLYQLNDEAAAFFKTLRGLIARDRFGVVLVGGENLSFVLTALGSALNVLDGHRVDSFRRENQFSDFAQLVRQPTAGALEFSPEAVECLYDECSGHPYFAKLICRSLFVLMVERHDASVTAREVREAINSALAQAEVTAFAHFWDDGIFETDPGRRQDVARKRRLTLLALSRALRSADGSTREHVEAEADRISLPGTELAMTVASFERRGVLLNKNGTIDARIPFFGRWLRDYGTTSIVVEVTDRRAQTELRAHLDEAAIASSELTALASSWGLYRNREITSDAIREWLEQFGGVFEQRRALELIKQLRFFTGLEIRARFSQAHQRLTTGWRCQLGRGHKLFTDVLVVPLDDPGKSGYTYGSTYVVENRIHKANVVPKKGLDARLKSTNRELAAVVFVDDFIGSGGTVIERLSTLPEAARNRLREPGLESALIVIAGFEQGITAVETWLAEQRLPIRVYPQQLFDHTERAFDPESRFFEDPAERVATQALFEQLGARISPEHPLGWFNSQALVVFESSVPNNTLPHVWIERAGENEWHPLFGRF